LTNGISVYKPQNDTMRNIAMTSFVLLIEIKQIGAYLKINEQKLIA
jgi:hypothetical protein